MRSTREQVRAIAIGSLNATPKSARVAALGISSYFKAHSTTTTVMSYIVENHDKYRARAYDGVTLSHLSKQGTHILKRAPNEYVLHEYTPNGQGRERQTQVMRIIRGLTARLNRSSSHMAMMSMKSVMLDEEGRRAGADTNMPAEVAEKIRKNPPARLKKGTRQT